MSLAHVSGKTTSPRRENPLVAVRTAVARRMARGMRVAVQRVVYGQVHEAASRVRRGLSPVPEDYLQRWGAALIAAQERRAIGIAIQGWRHAANELDGKALDGDAVAEMLIRGEERFVLDPVGKEVTTWLETVGAKSTRTNAKRINSVFDEALATWDPVTRRGMTPAQIAKNLEGMAADFSKKRARTIANTTTMYSFNGGIRQQYIHRGVTVLEWWTSQDDAVCIFCGPMHGQRIPSTDAFWLEGDAMGVLVGDVEKELNITYDIYHPPLHPHCACSLLPVIIDVPMPVAPGPPPKPGKPGARPPTPREVTTVRGQETRLRKEAPWVEEVDLTGLAPKEAKDVVDEILRAAKRRGKPPRGLRRVVTTDKVDSMLARGGNTIEINPSGVRKLVEWQRTVGEAPVGGVHGIKGAVRHELGHCYTPAIYDSSGKLTEFGKRLETFVRANRAKIVRDLGRAYADDAKEFVAEAFARRQSGNAPAWVKRFLKQEKVGRLLRMPKPVPKPGAVLPKLAEKVQSGASVRKALRVCTKEHKRLMERFPLLRERIEQVKQASFGKLQKVVVEDVKRVHHRLVGVYDPRRRHIAIAGKGGPIKAERSKLSAAIKGKRWAVNSDIGGTFRHEYGHHVKSVFHGQDIDIDREWRRLFRSHNKEWWEQNISTYAATSEGEAFAECFSFHTDQIRTGVLPDDLHKFFVRIMGRLPL